MFLCFLTNVFHSKEMPSLLSIASKIAATHMNSTLSDSLEVCVMDFRIRCYCIFPVVNILQCSQTNNFFFLKVFPLINNF